MGLLSNKIRREQLNPGDHIYTWRCGYSYSHHGIYVDDGKVIHLTRAPGLIIFSSTHDESSPSHPSGEDPVVCCSLEEFLSDGDLYLYEYGVNRALYLIQRGGTCTPFTSYPPKDVLHCASILLEKGFGPYNLFQNNCEDFAVYCKTRLLKVGESNIFGSSGQIQFLVALVSGVIYTPSQFLSLSLVLLINGLLYCGFRLIIINEVVEKVAVEKFYDLRNQRTTIRMENRSTEVSGLLRVGESNSFDSSGLTQFLVTLLYGFILTPFQFLPLGPALLVCGLLLYWGFRLIVIIISTFEKFFDSENQLTTRMENRSTEASLSAKYYITYSTLIFNLSTPTSRILLFIYLYIFGLYPSTFDLLRNGPINLKLEEYVGWTIWALGYWYWRSESRIFFRTKLICLESFLFLFVSNHTRRSKIGYYIAHTTLALGCCYWTSESTILLWIRLVLLHIFLFYFVSNQLFNNHFKFGRCFFACFVFQSAVLFFGIGLRGLFF